MSSFATRQNLELIEEQYAHWKRDNSSVDSHWQAFFEGFELAGAGSTPASGETGQTDIVRLIYNYRNMGHLMAHLDPLSDPPSEYPNLAISEFGFTPDDLNKTYDASAFAGMRQATLAELLAALKETYCGKIGIEYLHIQDTEPRSWVRDKVELCRSRPALPLRQKYRVLMTLHYAELFERFLHTRYQGQKRFSLEGSETLIPVLDALVEKAPSLGVKEIVLGMAHRGRLNVLANILHKPYQDIFNEFEDNFLLDSIDGDGDVKYHLGFSYDYTTSQGQQIHLSLTPNPSHLEAVNPVVEGRVRAKQWLFADKERIAGLPLLIHGDAAFAGQGIVAETLNLSNLEGYTTGGTVHVVINNQIGFTTSPKDARSTTYCTDVAKMIQAPIFHVNAEDPEACVFVTELALEFRQKFHRDVIIDLYCYRKHGHNEGDEPSFTQPIMYRKIKDRPSVSAIYTEQLVTRGEMKPEEADAIKREFQTKLDTEQEIVKKSPPRPRGMKSFSGSWQGMNSKFVFEPAPTAVSREVLQEITEIITTVPPNFTINPKITSLLQKRSEDFAKDRGIDWAFGEALAFGSLVKEGNAVRLSGQDSRRGTFSQRHATFTDVNSGERYVPLRKLNNGKVTFAVFDSLLSEAAVLGFEFGYSLDDPSVLVLWEAQFGDFANGAQAIIDQFIVPSESKWQRSSGLVMLLPHGYEGQGPEHSSARLERFLQSCADDNIQVCNLSTPAQYFHVLRRQMKRTFRKPLVIMTPKSLLRHKDAVSPVAEFTHNRFHEILDDSNINPAEIKRVLWCSGKLYYELLEKRNEKKAREVAIIRLEQFYPFAAGQAKQILSRYSNARDFFWVQEESKNMGGWTFVDARFREELGINLRYIGRHASASPATGSHKVHVKEQKELVEAAFADASAVAGYTTNGIHGANYPREKQTH
ncbi:2-oxoglutarate dehydrogenase E1 component [Telmatocola sphagniphila]|uniref:oxoglutarate dehydrogenase (succinyl-transferring) n=1 Tax=Telmatocola sphagniphila TaxID=1123043 RepID=A0A8E6B7I1_9BACT|nr:2-oxoglutarate dehydrogenase E1 component [Telmatocola sphagniphila]QVL31983.1 2-oxoglutarate dehydrogenase E1 component [Telmatocola sphagniphila]